ncbi:MAG: beta strand repeat-containing protein, partial [Limisphaerales bacterium]
MAVATHAAVTLTPASGGNSISADSTGATFTSLTGPVLTEGATGDIGAGTIVLNCPDGFEFDTNSTVTVVVTGSGSGNDVALTSGTAVVTSTNITIEVSAPSDGTEISILTWSGIGVRPTAGAPLASGTVSESGTATFTLDSTPSDHYGALTEVAGTVAALAFATQPGSATAGAAFGTQPVVVTQDQFGNASTNGLGTNLDVTVTLSAGAGTLQGTSTVDIGTTAGNGTATFTDLQIDVAGTDKQLTASASGLTSASSSVFSVNHASATALVIQQQPSSSATAGVAFSQQPLVRIEDGFGNLVDDDNSTIVTAARNAGSGVLQGTLTAPVSGGVATFTDLAHNVAGNITITFSSGSLTSATSSSVAVSPAAADHLVFTAQPGSATAGSTFGTQPSLITEDQFGNASIGGLTGNLNVTIALSSGTGSLQGTTTQDIGTAAGNGTVTFTDLRIDTAGSKQLTASASGLTSVTSSAFTVNHASASALALQQQPSSSATAGVAFAQQPIVRIEDGFGNLVDDDNSTIVTAARNAGSGTLQGTLTATVSGGTATFANLAHNVAGNITISFSSGALTSATSSSISISPAAADHLVFTTQPASATAGAAFGGQPSLIAQDQFGNASTVGLSSNLNVTISVSSGTGSLQGTTTQDIGTAAGNGSVTFTDLRIDTAGNKQLTASASGLTSATSSSFAVNHAAASALAIQQQPSSSATSGVAFAQQPVVILEDAYGNLISDDNSTVVTATRNSGAGTLQGTLNVTVSSGVATFTDLAHNVAGNITITFSSGSLASATSSSVAVSPAAADHLVFVSQAGSATAGSVFGSQPSLVSEDQFGNASTVGLPTNLDVTVTLSAGSGPLQGTTTQDIGTTA